MILELLPNLNHFPVPIGNCIPWLHGQDGIKTYALSCPWCSKAFCLANHTIENGKVMPSVVCPFNCGFHEFVEIK